MLFLHRLRAISRIDTAGTQKKKVLNAITERGFKHIILDAEIFLNKVCWKLVIRQDVEDTLAKDRNISM